ncbi:MAG TPA: hypothetical protein VGC76_13070 [Pyrinomonadaceae bacterium]|jgi:hypothetical protein
MGTGTLAKQRVTELEEMVLDIVEEIDNADQSRVGLLTALDNVRNIASIAYGDDFDDDVAKHLGYDLEDDEDEDED